MLLRELTAADIARHGWTASDRDELQGLEQSEAVDEAGWRRWHELRHRLHEANVAAQLEYARELKAKLTPEEVLELERRCEAWDETMTQVEHNALAALQRLSMPIGQGEAAWERWDRRPIADSLFGPMRPVRSLRMTHTAVRQRRSGERRPRRRTTSNTRGSPVPLSDGDEPPPDPDDLAASVEAVVARHRAVAAECGMSWIGDLVRAELDRLEEIA